MAQQFQNVNGALPIVSTDLSGFSLMCFLTAQKVRSTRSAVENDIPLRDSMAF
jgi:hypothetical protein